MIAESMTTIILLSVLVEIVTNAFKAILPVIKKYNGNGSRLAAAIVGILLCVSTKIGILQNFSITVNPVFIDYFVTGIVISRGSNAVHDIISIFEKNKTSII